jgi:hypothetical protein
MTTGIPTMACGGWDSVEAVARAAAAALEEEEVNRPFIHLTKQLMI